MAKGFRVIGAFLLAALCWEALLTFIDGRNSGYVKANKLGVVLQKGVVVEANEGFSITHINSSHFRGGELKKDDSKKRVMVLGDSYTLAAQVGESSSFVKIAESLFKKNGREDVEVLNTGQFGKGPAYYLSFGKGWAEALHPDFVTVQLNEGDFLSDFYDSTRDAYVKRVNGEFQIVENPKIPGKLTSLLTKSTVVNKIATKWEESRRPAPASASDDAPKVEKPFKEETLWLMQTLKATFPNVAVIYIPTLDYHSPNTLERLPALEVSLADAATKAGVPYVNARPQFAQFYKETKQPCHGFNNSIIGTGHANGYGHRIIGEALYQLISPLVPK